MHRRNACESIEERLFRASPAQPEGAKVERRHGRLAQVCLRSLPPGAPNNSTVLTDQIRFRAPRAEPGTVMLTISRHGRILQPDHFVRTRLCPHHHAASKSREIMISKIFIPTYLLTSPPLLTLTGRLCIRIGAIDPTNCTGRSPRVRAGAGGSLERAARPSGRCRRDDTLGSLL